GIIGLDVALVLAERGFGHHITIVAEYLPGDTHHSYTSPWAGCNFSAISGTDPNALKWDRAGYAHLARLASRNPDEAFVQRTPSIEFWDSQVPHDKISTMAEYLEDFRVLPLVELPTGTKFGVSFTTFTINAPKHIVYLREYLRDTHGVTFKRQRLPSIHAAYSDPATRLVFNCTGNAAGSLPGVADPKCYPTRGQVLLARAPAVTTNMMRHGDNYETYIIPRPLSGGHAILGGFMQKRNGDAATYGDETSDIISRVSDLGTELCEHDFDVLAAFSGLRPSREGGARVERDAIAIAGVRRPLIHNYGAGGTGYQAGYGMAVDAVRLAEDLLGDFHVEVRARL
ncbi:hypothetical protein F5X68DRAFT_140256, partial [Plectosphaerella plurivora]